MGQRKNRCPQSPQRNGLTESSVNGPRSTKPLRLDLRTCSLRHRGQRFIWATIGAHVPRHRRGTRNMRTRRREVSAKSRQRLQSQCSFPLSGLQERFLQKASRRSPRRKSRNSPEKRPSVLLTSHWRRRSRETFRAILSYLANF
jgi:hypothetical protein